jgi:hypothetical protein
MQLVYSCTGLHSEAQGLHSEAQSLQRLIELYAAYAACKVVILSSWVKDGRILLEIPRIMQGNSKIVSRNN